jgi:hypothetical protein
MAEYRGVGTGGKPALPPRVRFWRYVIVRQEGCWGWALSTDKDGFGWVYYEGEKRILAHRLSWEIHVGPIPPGRRIIQSCGSHSCARPDHLLLMTPKEAHRHLVKERAKNGP